MSICRLVILSSRAPYERHLLFPTVVWARARSRINTICITKCIYRIRSSVFPSRSPESIDFDGIWFYIYTIYIYMYLYTSIYLYVLTFNACRRWTYGQIIINGRHILFDRASFLKWKQRQQRQKKKSKECRWLKMAAHRRQDREKRRDGETKLERKNVWTASACARWKSDMSQVICPFLPSPPWLICSPFHFILSFSIYFSS